MADAANVVETAMEAQGMMSEASIASEEEFNACIDGEILRAEDIISKHVKAMKDADSDVAVLSGWKRKWRSRRPESSHQQREVSMM